MMGIEDWASSLYSEFLVASNKWEHPEYNPTTIGKHALALAATASSNTYILDNDFALLLLPTEITFSRIVQRVCLPPKGWDYTFEDFPTTVTGYGLTNGNDPSSWTTKLNEVELTVISNTMCAQYYGSIITPAKICATAPGKGSCNGDSGGESEPVYTVHYTSSHCQALPPPQQMRVLRCK